MVAKATQAIRNSYGIRGDKSCGGLGVQTAAISIMRLPSNKSVQYSDFNFCFTTPPISCAEPL
jgi:hypothetical protein